MTNNDFIVTGLSLNFINEKIEEIEYRVKWANIMLIIIYVSTFYFSLVSFETILLHLLFVQLVFFFNDSSFLFKSDSEISYLEEELDILRNRNFVNIYMKDERVVYLLLNGVEFESSLFNNIVFSPGFRKNNLNLNTKSVEIVGNYTY